MIFKRAKESQVSRGIESCRALRLRSQKPLKNSSTTPSKPVHSSLTLRLIFLHILIVSSGAFLAQNLYRLQVSETGQWVKLGDRQHNTSKKVKGARGQITDRYQRPLAISVRSYDVGVNPKRVKDLPALSSRLEKLGNLFQPARLELLSKKRKFFWLARGLHPELTKDFQLSRIKGLNLIPRFQRVYPQGDLASSLLGVVGREGNGLAGMERILEKSLEADSRVLKVERDARGRLVSKLAGNVEPLKPEVSNGQGVASERNDRFRDEGARVSLTVDSVLQRFLEEELDVAREESQAAQAMGLMMDADSGEILSVAQTKRFNPNSSKGLDPDFLKNSVFQDQLEPGSTLKPLVLAEALERRYLGDRELIDCQKGKMKIGKHTIRDVHRERLLSVEDVVISSSNVGMIKIAERMGKEVVWGGLNKLGFGKSSGLGWPGEGVGILRKPERWKDIDLATASFGHGLAVTMVQMARAYSAIANGGFLPSPSLLLNSSNNGAAEKRVFSPSTVFRIKEVLRGVVESEKGTGKNAKVEGIEVYGKTGTSHKPKVDGRGYDKDKVISSFIGFAEGSKIGVDRKLVLYVIVDEPSVETRWGGTLAAPVFSRVISRSMQYLASMTGSKQKALQRLESPQGV